MDSVLEFFNALNSLSPLAVIGLLGYIIFMLVKGKTAAGKTAATAAQKIHEVQTNHLHELPEILATLQRIEVKLGEEFSYIKARINGHK